MTVADDTGAVDVRTDLDAFFKNNPEASLRDTDDTIVIELPWNDHSIEIHVEPGDRIIAALNELRLFPEFAALYHLDTSDIEFIFAAVPLQHDLSSRSFDFTFEGSTYRCEYKRGSNRLEEIARSVHPVAASDTGYRNLLSIGIYLATRERHSDDNAEDQILSFWVRDVPNDALTLSRMANHMNLYMGYYDRAAPTIQVFDDQEQSLSHDHSLLSYPVGAFPSAIVASPSIDNYLLQLWLDARASDPVLRFIHCYQIIEYVAFYHLKDELARDLRRLLSAPHITSDIGTTTRSIIDLFASDQMTDDQKIDAVIKRYVDPRTLWPFVEHRRGELATATTFEGGILIDALVTNNTTVEEWCSTSWHPGLITRLRTIRNALVHGRERRQAQVIAPTTGNIMRLRPWNELILEVAGQLVLYSTD